MRFTHFINIKDITEFFQTIRLNVVLGILGSSFILASALTFFGGLYIKPSPTPRRGLAQNEERVGSGRQKKTLDKKDINAIKNRNIFNSEGVLGDEETVPVASPEPAFGEIVKSTLPLKLVGIIFGGTPEAGLAMIKNTKKQRISSYLVGDNIMQKVILREVYESRIVIENSGRAEYIELEKVELVRTRRDKKNKVQKGSSTLSPIAKGPVADSFREDGFERQGHTIKITQTYKEALLGPQMSKVLQDAKAEPNMVNGALEGFRLSRIRENSIYQKVGFQSGDIVHEINGVPLTDAAGAIRLLQSLRQENDVEVRVQRGSEFFNMDVTIQ